MIQHPVSQRELPPLPPLDAEHILPYSLIRYVAGYPESYVKAYAQAYARSLPAAPGWRTMDSAPKDGTQVLLYHSGVRHAFYPRDESPRWWVDAYTSRGWYRAAPDAQPTHWQPRPSPPLQQDPEQGGRG